MIPTRLLTSLTATAGGEGLSWFETIQKGGIVGVIIIMLSIAALALMIMHLLQIRRGALIPPPHLEQLDTMLGRGDVNQAVEYCLDPGNDSYLTRILAGGLTRYQKSAFGAFEFKNAIEEAAEEATARLYRSTDGLGVIGSIAPLLGLLGTVLGMIGAFETLGRSAGSQYEALASDISLALVTTLMGLILAIPCIALFTFFRNRIDSFAAEASVEIERLTLHLESVTPAASGRAAPRTTPAARPAAGGAAAGGPAGPSPSPAPGGAGGTSG